jgi:hypothetical protein
MCDFILPNLKIIKIDTHSQAHTKVVDWPIVNELAVNLRQESK